MTTDTFYLHIYCGIDRCIKFSYLVRLVVSSLAAEQPLCPVENINLQLLSM